MIVAGRARVLVLLPALILALGSMMLQAQSASPKPIALEDYAKFKRITGAAISADGKWMHYTVTPNDGDATLLVKALDGDKVYEVPRGANPAFSEDGKWVAYFIAPPASEGRGRGRGARGGDAPAGRRQRARGDASVRGHRTRHRHEVFVPVSRDVCVLARRRLAPDAAAECRRQHLRQGRQRPGEAAVAAQRRTATATRPGPIS